MRFIDLADFSLSNDMSRLDIHPVPGVAQDVIDHLEKNFVIPLALSHQNKLLLHASAVEVHGRAAVFLAESGVGKSTLAAYFASHGFPFLTDDVVEIEHCESGYRVRPGHGSIRLWEYSGEELDALEIGFSSMSTASGKTRFLASKPTVFCDQAKRLQNTYILDPTHSDSITIQEVSGSQVVTSMLQNCFLLDVEARSSLTSNFENLSRLAALPGYFRLSFPRDYSFLPQLCDQIVAHMLSTRVELQRISK
ncbi:MAG: hypothetical protein AB8B81_00105 [Halioglobus sp.]